MKRNRAQRHITPDIHDNNQKEQVMRVSNHLKVSRIAMSL